MVQKRKHDFLLERIATAVQQSILVKQQLASIYPQLAQAIELIAHSLEQGGRVLLFGNGGSAADAQHIAAELVGRFCLERPALAAIALTTNASSVTAIANDHGFDQVFARQLRAFSRPGDVAIAISTSGTSKNVLEAAKLKSELDFRLIALTGAHAELLQKWADVVLAVPNLDVPRIQEAHILIGHILCDGVEQLLFGK